MAAKPGAVNIDAPPFHLMINNVHRASTDMQNAQTLL